MTIEQLPSGSYRIRQFYNGKRYSVTVPYKPTKKEAMKLISDKMEQEDCTAATSVVDNATTGAFIDKYIDLSRSRKRTPATLNSYNSIKRNLSEHFLSIRFFDLTSAAVQSEIKSYSENHSPKSVRNMYGLIKAVLDEYRPSFVLSVKLPHREKFHEYEPTSRDIQRITEYIAGSRYEIVIRLCIRGLRRGEALAITSSDVDEYDVLTIDKAIGITENNSYAVKLPKTEASNRRIKISHDLADMIRSCDGPVFVGNAHTVNEYLHKVQRALDIPSFRLHTLRHFCAAYLLKENRFTALQIKAYMGWEPDSNVMEKVYSYNLDPEESQDSISVSLSRF